MRRAPLLALASLAFMCGDPADTDGEDEGTAGDVDTEVDEGTDVDAGTDVDEGTDVDPDTNWLTDPPGEPVALCFVDAPAKVLDTEPFYLDGTGSFAIDPGHVAAWNWEVVSAPAGSFAEVWSFEAGWGEFVPDSVGWYDLELTVEDEWGQVSEPCVLTLGVSPFAPVAECDFERSVAGEPVLLLGEDRSVAAPPATYQWTIVEPDPAVSIVDATAGNALVNAPDASEFEARFALFDGYGVAAPVCRVDVPELFLGSVDVDQSWDDAVDLDLVIDFETSVGLLLSECRPWSCIAEDQELLTFEGSEDLRMGPGSESFLLQTTEDEDRVLVISARSFTDSSITTEANVRLVIDARAPVDFPIEVPGDGETSVFSLDLSTGRLIEP